MTRIAAGRVASLDFEPLRAGDPWHDCVSRTLNPAGLSDGQHTFTLRQ